MDSPYGINDVTDILILSLLVITTLLTFKVVGFYLNICIEVYLLKKKNTFKFK